MRLLIETTGVRFRAGGPAKPKADYKDKDQQATTPDGRPIWVVRLTAFDTRTEQGSSESIWVEVAGDKPELTADELVDIAAWCSRRGSAARHARTTRSCATSAPSRCSWPRPAASPPCTRPDRPGQARTIPCLAITTKENPMTITRIYDPASAGTALPELPPLPIGALAVGAQNLLQEAADLPSPCYIAIFRTQHISVQFDGADPSSMRAVTRWALRFGGVVTSRALPGRARPGDLAQHRVRLLRRVRPGLHPHPGRDRGHLTQQCRAWETPSPGPASQNLPLPREKQRSFGMSQATSAAPPRVVLDWRRGSHRPAGTLRAVRDPGRVPLPGHRPGLP